MKTKIEPGPKIKLKKDKLGIKLFNKIIILGIDFYPIKFIRIIAQAKQKTHKVYLDFKPKISKSGCSFLFWWNCIIIHVICANVNPKFSKSPIKIFLTY